jgi:hypothetical protein
VREQRVVLEDRVDVARVGRAPGDVGAGELDAAAVGQLEARDQAQRRRLARPGRPEQREELAARDVEREIASTAVTSPKRRVSSTRRTSASAASGAALSSVRMACDTASNPARA